MPSDSLMLRFLPGAGGGSGMIRRASAGLPRRGVRDAAGTATAGKWLREAQRLPPGAAHRPAGRRPQVAVARWSVVSPYVRGSSGSKPSGHTGAGDRESRSITTTPSRRVQDGSRATTGSIPSV